ncbi:alpha/beta hydrolase [Marinobacterium sp. AK62]|uniref:Alpha/beta hydrolase n=1 Tax=Marinobacterium alkalitolerans TaxID=1542925 RepID=A0ABS3Z7Z3_9GAMM|nr:alpha/beta hydrolase [Marinobacterium alkalitolerans]MBP0047830.1 alpha/beta hydrolase [Marinobacterium alkalitolerans]
MGNHIFNLNEKVTRKAVTYKNRFGIELAGELYLPTDFDPSGQYPALVIGAPYGGVKEQGPGIYANELAQRGYVALTFDPSYNGDSSGFPRHLSSPEMFVEDFHAGVDFIGTRAGVDRNRIGIIGICGSGGFGLSAAQVDPRIKAVATVSMYDISRMHAEGFAGSLDEDGRKALLDSLAEQRWAEFESGRPELSERGSPLDIDDNTHPIGREFGEFYSRSRGYHPNSITQFTQTSMQSFMNFPLLDKLEWISPRPILLIMGEHAHSRFYSEDIYAAAAEPKELYVVPGSNHVDLYDRTDVIPFDKLDRFFAEALTLDSQ